MTKATLSKVDLHLALDPASPIDVRAEALQRLMAYAWELGWAEAVEVWTRFVQDRADSPVRPEPPRLVQ